MAITLPPCRNSLAAIDRIGVGENAADTMFIMIARSSITTAEQVLAAGDIGRCELVRGELIMMSPAGHRHGRVAMRIGSLLDNFVQENNLGTVYAAETGFLLRRNPDTVRAPDVAFVRRERLAEVPDGGYFPGAPDLAVEVLSPSDTASDVLAKVHEWLDGGCEEVWVADPERKTIAVYRKDQPVRTLAGADNMANNSPLPGFSMRVSDVFE